MATSDAGKPRIIFWGTPEFAVPSLEALLDARYPVVAVISNPDEPAGRSKNLTVPPIKKIAEIHHLETFQPVALRDKNFRDKLPSADLFVIAAYGKIIPRDILAQVPRGALNVHPSILPRWRGPSPIQFAILHGDEIIGVSIMLLDELMDHGPILAAETVAVNSRATYPELHDLLAKKGAALLLKTIPQWIDKQILPIAQDDNKATYSKILKKDDGRIDWKKPADAVDRQIRAFIPWPGAWTLWLARKKIFRLRIEKTEVIFEEHAGFPGNVLVEGGRLLVQTGKGMLKIEMLTIEGKKSSAASSFLRGYPEIAGSTLI